MKILSLFDGISGAYVALQRAGIKIEKYYASEIDKYTVAVSKYNFPNIIRLGDVKNVKAKDLPKIDLLIGGSPCQDLSCANPNGKGLVGKKSGLFYEYLRILKEVRPKYFLLENVASMKKKDKEIIIELLGVEPVMINSALVSAQHRKRLYWTNIPITKLPEDKHIYLKDILEAGDTDREKSYPITATYMNAIPKDYFEKSQRQLIFITKGMNEKKVRKLTPVECERLQTYPDNFTQYGIFEDGEIKEVSNTQRYKMLGNSFTVDVIAWILKHLKEEK